MGQKKSRLVLVGMPLGNVDDIGRRAVTLLADADLILCEDLRVTSRFFKRWGVTVERERLHLYNEHTTPAEREEILRKIEHLSVTALLSDAGMPVICDPGGGLVRRAMARGISVEVIPGPTAIGAALALAGLGGDGYYFAGFPPRETEKRHPFLKNLASIGVPVVLYETPYRIKKMVAEVCVAFPKHKRFFLGINIGTPEQYVIDIPLKELASFHYPFPKGPPVFILYDENGIKG